MLGYGKAVLAADALHRSLGLTDDELVAIERILGREPNELELAMYAVMWSVHCSYKSSRAHLGRLPTEAPWVLVGPGENAGVIDAGDDIAVAVRIESHNHPSAVEPHQGAATGVGGILRDIFTMGARPIATLDPLRFGPLTSARARWLFEGVVNGISSYGNSVGVPTVGGEVAFDVDAVPRREPGMQAFEVMTSESQERMLAIVRPDDLDAVTELCRRWEVRANVVGRVNGSGRLRVFEGGDLVADVPAASLHED